MGCTHVSDPVHRERFWHPPVPEYPQPFLTPSSEAGSVGAGCSLGAGPGPSPERGAGAGAVAAPGWDVYPCHECGLNFRDLAELQLHLKRKTAWSNKSLVGCRISCLVDNREWQEGLVLEFSAITGKHRVSLEHLGEVRWMNMLRTAFFIVQRPVAAPGSRGEQSETKDVEMDLKGLEMTLAPIEQWTFAEEISLDYARSQAMMHKAYGSKIQETGHKTQGHLCVTEQDKVGRSVGGRGRGRWEARRG
jgi:hypothetical protein